MGVAKNEIVALRVCDLDGTDCKGRGHRGWTAGSVPSCKLDKSQGAEQERRFGRRTGNNSKFKHVRVCCDENAGPAKGGSLIQN